MAYQFWTAAATAALLLSACGGGTSDTAAAPAAKLRQGGAAAGAAAASTLTIYGPSTNYSITQQNGVYTVTHLAGIEPARTLADGSRIHFSDTSIALDTGGVPGQVYRIYQAAFNRTPDAAGLGYWMSQMDQGASQIDVASAFIRSGEFIALYGADPDPQSLVSKIYFNVLHRAPEKAGLDYWVGVLRAGAARGDVLSAIAQSQENQDLLAPAMANGIRYTASYPSSISLLAGDGVSAGDEDGTLGSARFIGLTALGADAAGNIALVDGNRIRKFSTQSGISTVAGDTARGYAEGTGSAARFAIPADVELDAAGNMYVSDAQNKAIRKITPAGVVTTLAGGVASAQPVDGPGAQARLTGPGAMEVAPDGTVFVLSGHALRKITPQGVVSTLAGAELESGISDGQGSAARFSYPKGIALDSAGNLYVADAGNYTIRKVTPTGQVSTIMGLAGQRGRNDGSRSEARLFLPWSVAVAGDGTVYVAELNGGALRKMTPDGQVTTPVARPLGAGEFDVSPQVDGPLDQARVTSISDLVLDAAGNLTFIDVNLVRKISNGVLTTLTGTARETISVNGTSRQARFRDISALQPDKKGNVYVADSYSAVRKIAADGTVSTVAGALNQLGKLDGPADSASFYFVMGLALDPSDNLYVSDWSYKVRKITPAGMVSTHSGTGTAGKLDGAGGSIGQTRGLVWNTGTGTLALADTSNHMLREVKGSTLSTILAYPEPELGPTLDTPTDVAVVGKDYYIVDQRSSEVRRVAAGGRSQLFAGATNVPGYADGKGNAARFNSPTGIAADSQGNLYVADTGNHVIRKITPDGTVSTVAGTFGRVGLRTGSLPGGLYYPRVIRLIDDKTLVVDSDRNVVKIALP
jgi:sugar lactone lactonase YvrE